MKTKFYFLVSLLTLIVVSAVSNYAQQSLPDLSMRNALYFTGAKTNKIDLATDKYVGANGTMELKKSQATSCDDSGCIFNLGFIAFRSGNTGTEVSTYGLFEVENGGAVGNTVIFPQGSRSQQGVHAVKLKMGMNKVTFTMDPYKKTAETNENNNSLSVNFSVSTATVFIRKKGIVSK